MHDKSTPQTTYVTDSFGEGSKIVVFGAISEERTRDYPTITLQDDVGDALLKIVVDPDFSQVLATSSLDVMVESLT